MFGGIIVARKSNKTAHVLGLITNEKKETSPVSENNETSETSSETITIEEEKMASKTPKVSVPILEIAQGDNSRIASTIRDKLIEEVFDGDLEKPISLKTPNPEVEEEQNVTSHEVSEENATSNQTAQPLEQAEFNSITESASSSETPSSSPLVETDSCVSTNEDSSPLDSDCPTPITEQVSECPTPITEEISECPDSSDSDIQKKQLEQNSSLSSNYEYAYINVAESVVKEKVLEYMKRFNMCTCDRCVMDTIALALTYLPAKYIVAHKSTTFSMTNFYSTKYHIQIISQLTKACMVVSQHPHHHRAL